MNRQMTLILLALAIFLFSVQGQDKPFVDIMTIRTGHQDQKQIDLARDFGLWTCEFNKAACFLVDYDDDDDDEDYDEGIWLSLKRFVH